MNTTPEELTRACRAQNPNSLAVPFSVSVWRRSARERLTGLATTRSFDTREKAMSFFQRRHAGAHYAEFREFNGTGYTVTARRGTQR